MFLRNRPPALALSRHMSRKRGPSTRLLLAPGVLAMMLGLSACTAQMDMTIDADGTYDAVLVMRDTTGTVFTADTDCDDYTDPALVGANEDATITSTPIGSADDDDGLGCEVRITGVKVPEASTAEAQGALVVRDDDLYVVTLAPYLDAEATAASADPAADPAAEGTADPAAEASAEAGADSGVGASPEAGSLGTVVDAHLEVTFPGAVVDDGGGTVSGTTVTWDDADVLSQGVSASGYAAPDQGMSAWDRSRGWVIKGLVAVGVGFGAAALYRRRRARR